MQLPLRAKYNKENIIWKPETPSGENVQVHFNWKKHKYYVHIKRIKIKDCYHDFPGVAKWWCTIVNRPPSSWNWFPLNRLISKWPKLTETFLCWLLIMNTDTNKKLNVELIMQTSCTKHPPSQRESRQQSPRNWQKINNHTNYEQRHGKYSIQDVETAIETFNWTCGLPLTTRLNLTGQMTKFIAAAFHMRIQN